MAIPASKKTSSKITHEYFGLTLTINWNSFHALVGTWLSLVEHSVRDAGVAGSNPAVPTIYIIGLPSSSFSSVLSL